MEQAQEEMVVDATPKKTAFMNKRSTHEDRIKKDEEELEELKKQAKVKLNLLKKRKQKMRKNRRTLKKKLSKSVMEIYEDTPKKKKSQFQKQLDDLKAQLEKATKKEMKLPKTEEEIETWAKEYPDVAKISRNNRYEKSKRTV